MQLSIFSTLAAVTTPTTDDTTETHIYWVEWCTESDTRPRRWSTRVTIEATDPITDVLDAGGDRFYDENADSDADEIQIIDEGTLTCTRHARALVLIPCDDAPHSIKNVLFGD